MAAPEQLYPNFELTSRGIYGEHMKKTILAIALALVPTALSMPAAYADTLNFGFIACRETLPHMQRIAVYTGEALEELEAAVLQPRKRRAG